MKWTSWWQCAIAAVLLHAGAVRAESRLEFVNRTDHTLRIELSGPTRAVLDLAPGAKKSVPARPGAYDYAVRIGTTKVELTGTAFTLPDRVSATIQLGGDSSPSAGVGGIPPAYLGAACVPAVIAGSRTILVNEAPALPIGGMPAEVEVVAVESLPFLELDVTATSLLRVSPPQAMQFLKVDIQTRSPCSVEMLETGVQLQARTDDRRNVSVGLVAVGTGPCCAAWQFLGNNVPIGRPPARSAVTLHREGVGVPATLGWPAEGLVSLLFAVPSTRQSFRFELSIGGQPIHLQTGTRRSLRRGGC